MKKLRQLMLAAVIIGSVLALSARAAESFSVLLQKGIFAEETEGNLAAAIKIYQQITAEGATNLSVTAQAQYRLGVCYQKQGNKEQAIGILNDLLKQFPAEAALGQKARELLVGLGQTPSSDITIRKLSLTAAEIYSVSLDGRLVAYKAKENNNMVIYETATGKTWTAIKENADQNVWNAIISPDGRLIAYQISGLIYVARIDGAEAKRIYKCNEGSEILVHDWSADGAQLIVDSWDAKSCGVGTLDVKTGALKEVKRWTPSPRIGKVCLSSNGRYLAYRAGKGGENRCKIAVIDLESATETTVIEKEVGELVGWSPGDARFLFLSERTGVTGLWAITVREGKPSGEPELVKANVGDIYPICITRDGSIYYRESKSSEYIYLATANFQTGEISGQPRRVTDRFPGLQTMPVWSKGGQKLMLSVQGGQKRFVAVSLASGEQKDFPVSGAFTTPLQQYVWSPDGAFLLVQSANAAGNPGIHRYDLASETTETLLTQVQGAWSCHPRLSPDGSLFYYARRKFSTDDDKRDDWKDSIVRRNLRSGNEEIVYESTEKLQIWWPFELSPDGERLAIVASDQFKAKDYVVALKVRGVSGSETKELLRLAPRENLTSLAWTPDGKRIVYTKELPSRNQGADGQTEVWSTAVDSGQSVELKFSLPHIRHITIHPDGRQIAFRAGSSEGQDLWVMEGLMPKLVAQAAGMNIRRVLADASGVGEALTADGKYIRGLDWSTGDVVQYEVASGQRSRITNREPWSDEGKTLGDQTFSRDGKQITYHINNSEVLSDAKDLVYPLRIRNLDGSGLRTLCSEKGSYIQPFDWSPDAGSILALRDRNKAIELTLISTADGSVRALRSIPSSFFLFERASFSPDGRSVAFSFVRDGSPPHGDVFLMTADGRNEVVVAGHPAEDRLLGWTPDGRSLVFLSDRSGTWDIWAVHIAEGKQQGEPELLKKDFGYYSEVLGFAPDGSCYYKTHTASGGLYSGAVDLETGKVLGPPAPVTTRYNGPPSMPRWSPDGRNLLYLSRRGSIGPGNNILTIWSAATGQERFLSPRLRFVNQMSWAPDSRSVIALGIAETETGIFRIDTETSVITKLAGDGRYAPRLCPDAKTLVFVADGPIIKKRNLDTGEESDVVKTVGLFYNLSPDGRDLVFQVDGAVKTVSLNGGEPRELFRGLAKYYGLEWTRDGRYIVARARNTASSEIWRVPAEGGTPLKLDLSVPNMEDFTLNPDDRRFAFSVNEGSKDELWVLENFLPKEKLAGK